MQDKEADGMPVSEVTRATIRRGIPLVVNHIGSSRYVVTGGSEPHYVNLGDPTIEACDCGDYLMRGRVCKHIVAVMLKRRDKRLLARIAELDGRNE